MKYYCRYGRGLEEFGYNYGDLVEITLEQFNHWVAFGYKITTLHSKSSIVEFYL